MDVTEDRIQSIENILNLLPRLQSKVDKINTKLFKQSLTANEFREMVSERSRLLKLISDLEIRAKEMYNIDLQKPHEKLYVSKEMYIK